MFLEDQWAQDNKSAAEKADLAEVERGLAAREASQDFHQSCGEEAKALAEATPRQAELRFRLFAASASLPGSALGQLGCHEMLRVVSGELQFTLR